MIFDNLKPHLAPHVAESIERGGGQRPARAAVQFGLRPDRGVVVEVQRGTSSGRGRVRNDLYNAVGETLDHVTLQDIVGWFNHSRLYATHA